MRYLYVIKTIDWLTLGKLLPRNQKKIANSLKSCNKTLYSRLAILSEKPPVIGWAYNKASAAKESLVDDFEKKKNTLKMPVPEDKYTALVNKKAKKDVKNCAEFQSGSQVRLQEYEKQLGKTKNIIPFNQMTITDLRVAFPVTKLNN
ncbi:ATP synthase subunit d, mitochondrial-like isoform X1 [Acomys russatus]|uniref:ATP synthase subunit d, mitochondrial-like isoform X1 n=1 Tax=Acomys russatus TaxID=60746 RepID=UPI0021E28103|nr:ATP synthase subunit d, mitochondrial-like isoform X1 [Acomys russatus]